MSNLELFKNPLKNGNSLEVFNDVGLVFQSSGKWLHPLFELEDFLKNFSEKKSNLYAHDTAIGKAAAVLMIRLNIKHINANLISSLALDYINFYNQKIAKSQTEKIEVFYTQKVHRLLCATEEQLENLSDADEMYFLLRQRAKKVLGVSVSVQNLSYKWGNIKNLSFELKNGERLMILGENGSGKTTLLRLLSGIYSPISGKILIDGKNINQNPKFTIGYIPQQSEINSISLNVEEVVSLGIPKNAKNRKKIIEESLKRTNSLNLKNRNFSTLSGGEKQKVSISRCLAQKAKLLLLDEPTSSMDLKNCEMVTEILRSLSLTEIPTIIIVTHDDELVKNLGWNTLNLMNFSKTDEL